MASLVLTQVTFFLCLGLFLRLFTYRRSDGTQYRRRISALAVLVMVCSGRTLIEILQGDLLIPAECWPLVMLLAVFVAGVCRSSGNLASVMRPEPDPVWSGPDRRKVG